MSRHPGETTEQWSSRAAAEYRDAREAANAHRRRIANTGLAAFGDHTFSDDAYDAAMDRLDAAAAERGEAAIALVSELRKPSQ